MSLASIPGTPTDGTTSPMDAYLLEMYRQAAEGARPSARPRARGIGAFLAFVGLVTAALAVLFSIPEAEGGSLAPSVGVTLGAIGLVVSIAFYALEARRRRASSHAAHVDVPSDAAASVYGASAGFFGFAVVIGSALLLLR